MPALVESNWFKSDVLFGLFFLQNSDKKKDHFELTVLKNLC